MCQGRLGVSGHGAFLMRAPKAPPSALRFDVIALVLLAVGLLLAACVLSHNPAKTPDQTFPPEFNSTTLLGAPGAMLAENLFDALGIAVYALLAGWFVLTATLFLRRDLSRWALRIAGWTIMLPCVAVLADRFVPPIGNVTGSGGALGAFLAHWLTTRFPLAGRVLIFAVVAGLGLYLAADFAVIWLGGTAWRFLRIAGRVAVRIYERRPR